MQQSRYFFINCLILRKAGHMKEFGIKYEFEMERDENKKNGRYAFSKGQLRKIKERLKSERGERPCSEIESLLNISHTAYDQYENPKKSVLPPYPLLLKLCNFYNCDIAYLLGVQEERNASTTDVHDFTGLPESVIDALHERCLSQHGYHEWLNQKRGTETPFDYTVEPFLHFLMTSKSARRFLEVVSLDKDYRVAFSDIQQNSKYPVVADAFSRALEEVEDNIDTDTYLLSLYRMKPSDHWNELSQKFNYWLNQGIKAQKTGNNRTVDEWVQTWFRMEPRKLLGYLFSNSEIKERDLRLQMWFMDIANEFFKGGAE